MEFNFEEEKNRLTAILNQSPSAAIKAARELPMVPYAAKILRAAILCDAGNEFHDISAVDEAYEIFKEACKSHPENGSLLYNFANCISNKMTLEKENNPDWFEKTAKYRQLTRALYGKAAEIAIHEDLDLASQIMTNLGNSLKAEYRWIEAYESFNAALNLNRRNGAASGSAAKMLFKFASYRHIGGRESLIAKAKELADHAKSNSETVFEIAGPRALEAIGNLPNPHSEYQKPSRRDLTAYEIFVSKHRLALSPNLDEMNIDSKRWDDAHLHSISNMQGDEDGVPSIFAMFNVLKADYLVARDLLFKGITEGRHDAGLYMDTLNYAVYGQKSSRLVLAQRAALDILDKIAVAINHHLKCGLQESRVDFLNLWRQKPEGAWRQKFE